MPGSNSGTIWDSTPNTQDKAFLEIRLVHQFMDMALLIPQPAVRPRDLFIS